MESRDAVLVDNLVTDNVELRRLMTQHDAYERQITDLRSRRFLSPVEQRELNELKKMKLRGRDRIESILRDHR